MVAPPWVIIEKNGFVEYQKVVPFNLYINKKLRRDDHVVARIIETDWKVPKGRPYGIGWFIPSLFFYFFVITTKEGP